MPGSTCQSHGVAIPLAPHVFLEPESRFMLVVTPKHVFVLAGEVEDGKEASGRVEAAVRKAIFEPPR